MYIKRNISVLLTDEEREVLSLAQQILIEFENDCSSSDEEALQDLYDEYTDCVDHQYALPTAIDLLETILKDGDENEI